MGLAIPQEVAAAADAFAAVVLEVHRPFSGADQLFVELIEGLPQGEVGGDVPPLMALVTTGLICAALAPDAQGEFLCSSGRWVAHLYRLVGEIAALGELQPGAVISPRCGGA